MNENSLKLQKQLVYYQEQLENNNLVLRLIIINLDSVFYRGDIKDAGDRIRNNEQWSYPVIIKELQEIVEIMNLYDFKLVKDLTSLKSYNEYQKLLKTIKTYKKDI